MGHDQLMRKISFYGESLDEIVEAAREDRKIGRERFIEHLEKMREVYHRLFPEAKIYSEAEKRFYKENATFAERLEALCEMKYPF